jgi:predicted component of type VI protein secretion system
VETDSHLQMVLYDISAEEIAADLASADDLQETGLYKLLVEQPALDAQQGALSVLVGNYTFLQTPPHADLLGRMAKLAATANAPFIASISKDCIDRTNPEDIHPMVKDAWDQLYALPEAAYLALTVPRFMLRWPYGKKTEPIDSFQFEEFTPQSGVGGMLWGNSAFLAGLLIAQTYQRDGGDALELGSILTIDDIPFYYYTDQDGDQVALPCTDRLLSTRMATHVRSQNFIPVLAIKGRNEVRLGGLHSLANQTLAGPWNAVNTTDAPKAASQSGVKSSQSRPAESDESSGNSSDDDLDAILSGLDDSPSEDSEDSESSSSDDLDLDSLLSSINGDDEIDASDDGGLDAELAALLGDL